MLLASCRAVNSAPRIGRRRDMGIARRRTAGIRIASDWRKGSWRRRAGAAVEAWRLH
jgi:hypothetical protein